ncbi:hypothetical protein KEM60_01171 [Austwickia sp. TVS 96-490-7B]|uniref:precorrin-6y C5,15-methyltransferase (decarboxylating) subunit CbiE n=1 Tax=Austwickia sp. TVS 96-490-7B TaxID=2830843 RepID=UPI001C59C8C3|nr:precorrin-6y C5,15-methyltransferase (decarboxylating) subunit CbiE [Austwickia sp. TVS 96-490-7B]MBW3084980.1 hypothetical protein [Austwickia sp. TVS 96-490-7B]
MIDVYGYLGEPHEAIRQACADADLVMAGARALDALQVPEERRLLLGRVLPAIDQLRRHLDTADDPQVVVLASGDPLFYGVVRRLRASGLPCRVHPAASSVATAFAAIGLPWDDAQVVSAHGHGLTPALAACRALPKVAMLTAPGHGIVQVAAGLADLPRWYVLAERLGESDERLRTFDQTTVSTLTDDDVAEPNVLIVLDTPPDSRAALGKPTAYVGGPRPASADFDDHPEQAGHHVMPPTGGSHSHGEIAADTASRPVPSTVENSAVALALGRHLPVLGEHVWTAGTCLTQVTATCARTGAAVVDMSAPIPAGLPDPDLVILDDLDRVPALAGHRPRVAVLICTEAQAQQAADALEALDLDGDSTVEYLAITGEDTPAGASYLITLRTVGSDPR